MRRMSWLATLLVVGCSDVRLDFPEEEIELDAVDNQLTITGEFLTSPAADVEYPVKVMFVVDGSGSQQFTDQNRQRVIAVEETINALIAGGPDGDVGGSVSFKIIVFNATTTATPPPPALGSDEPVFTSDLPTLREALNNLAEADTLTDYQGALSLAYSELNRDMQDVSRRSQAELGRTKYVTILVSDGMPDPQCTIGLGNDFSPTDPTQPYPICDDVDFLNCLLKLDCGEPGGTECEGGECTYGEARCFDQGVPTDPASPDPNGCDPSPLFGNNVLGGSELRGGEDYNQPYQILEKVEDIMELQDRYQAGEVRVHSALVLDPQADPAVIEIFGDASQAAPLMQQVAELGNGRYMEFYGGDEIDFLQLNYSSIRQNRVVRGFFADNGGLRMTRTGFEVDTDFDGLLDSEEFELGTRPARADGDGDGYRDIIEINRRGFGFDPNDPCYPRINDLLGNYQPGNPECDSSLEIDQFLATYFPCAGIHTGHCTLGDGNCTPAGFLDTDRDGLHDCEELAIGTSPDKPDTDHDGIPDLQEVYAGMDPKTWDYDRDDDKDGVPNGLELEWHLPPMIQQTEYASRDRYRYDRPEVGRTVDGRIRYRFSVRRIQLGATRDSEDLPEDELPGAGYNEIRLFILENMADNLEGAPLIRTACVRTKYVPPAQKIPANGHVELTDADFRYLKANEEIPDAEGFDPVQDCIFVEQ